MLTQGSKVMLHPGDAQDPDVANDIMLLPDTETLADRPKPCLAEVASLPRDWARLFDGQLFCIGTPSSCCGMHLQSCRLTVSQRLQGLASLTCTPQQDLQHCASHQPCAQPSRALGTD